MGRKTILVDDLTGEDLPSDTAPTRLSLGRKAYRLYLSDDSLEALYKALEPFVKDAEQDTDEKGVQAPKNDRARTRAIREWAQANKIEYNGKPLGDKGRIPAEIEKQYDAAHPS